MKRLLALSILSFSIFSWAQTWYYATPTYIPKRLEFQPSTDQQLCAAIQNTSPTSVNNVVRITLSPDFMSCTYPVVVWGVDPSGNEREAINIQAQFWGEGSLYDPETGLNALLAALQAFFVYNFKVSNLNAILQLQYIPELLPPTPAAIENALQRTDWQTLQDEQRIPIASPSVQRTRQYTAHPTCLTLFERGDCWKATLTWALPLRLVITGTEKGTFLVYPEPGSFAKKTESATLSVQEGRLTTEKPLIKPLK